MDRIKSGKRDVCINLNVEVSVYQLYLINFNYSYAFGSGLMSIYEGPLDRLCFLERRESAVLFHRVFYTC